MGSKEDARRYLEKAKATKARAALEGRAMTTSERATFELLLEKVEQYKSEAEMEGRIQDLGSKMGGDAGDVVFTDPRERRGLGFGGRVSGDALSPAGRKWVRVAEAAGWGAKGVTVTGAVAVPEPLGEPVLDPQRPAYVAQLPAIGRLSDTDQYSYMRESAAFTNAAAAVAHGAAKPESTLAIERVTESARTLAHLISDINNQDLQDAPFMTDLIGMRLLIGLREELDDQILNGNGTAPNLRGILQTSGIQTQAVGADTKVDAIRKAVTKLQLRNVAPDALVLNPSDWEELELLKDANDRYLLDGKAPWSLPVMTSSAIAAGTGLLGDFGGSSRIFVREEAKVEANPYASFGANKTNFRGEGRYGFAVMRPYAFVSITGL